MTTNSLQLSDSQIDRVLRQVIPMFNDQMRRELEAEVSVILPQSMQYLDFYNKIETLTNDFLINRILNWYPIFILNALDRSLKVQIHSLSDQSHTTRIDIQFPHLVLSDTLEAFLNRLRNSLMLPENPEWLTELLKHQSTMQLHLKWTIQDEEIVAKLVSAKADSDDWLATLLVSKADDLTRAVNRAFKLETMIQTRRFLNAA